MEILKRTIEGSEGEGQFSEISSDNEAVSLETQPEMIKAAAIEKKLHAFHTEAQKMKIEVSELASYYSVTQKKGNKEAVNIVENVNHSEIVQAAKKIINQPRASEEVLGEIAGQIPAINEYIKYFRIEKNKLESEFDKSSDEESVMEANINSASNNFAKRIFGISEKQKIAKELKDLKAKKAKIKIGLMNVTDYFRELTYKKDSLAEEINRQIGSKVRGFSNQLATGYEAFLNSSEDIDFLRNQALRDYIYKSLPDESSDSYAEIKRSVDEGLLDFQEKDKIAGSSFVIRSKLNEVEEGPDDRLKTSISRIAQNRFHKKVVNEVIAEDYMSECQRLFKPLTDNGFDVTHALKYSPLDIDIKSQDVLYDVLKKSDRPEPDEMAVWASIRHDPVFLKSFGKMIKELDIKKTETVLKTAIHSHEAPFIMEHFPDRRVLDLLLVMFFSQASSERVHTTRVLGRICKGEEWSEIISDFLIEYPELSILVEELSRITGFNPIPDNIFKDALENSKFTYDFFNKIDFAIDDSYLTKVALKATGTKNLMKIATEREIVTEEQVEDLTNALKKERDIEDKSKYFSAQFSFKLKEIIIADLQSGTLNKDRDQTDLYLQDILLPVAQKISELDPEKEEDEIKALLTHVVLFLNTSKGTTPEQLRIIISNLEKYQPLKYIYNIDSEVFGYTEYQTQEGLDYLLDFASLYDSFNYTSSTKKNILKKIHDGILERKNALLIASEAPDLLDDKDGLASVWMEYAQHFLSSSEAFDFARTCRENYGNNSASLSSASSLLKSDRSFVSVFADLPKKMPAVINVKEKNINNLLAKVLYKKDVFLSSPEAIAFANRVAGLYGNQAGKILDGYVECVDAGVIRKDEFALIGKFLESYRVVSPGIVTGYKEATANHQEDFYFTELNALAEKMIGIEALSEKDRAKPYFKDLLRHVYPQNSSNFGSYETIAVCEDRSGDLAKYKIKKKYEIDLMSAGTISLKEGTALDQEKIQKTQTHVFAIQKMFESVGFDPKKMLKLLDSEIGELFPQFASFKNREEKIFAGLTEVLYGTSDMDVEKAKQLVMAYEFSLNEDVREYIQGTSDRVSNASNKDYALLCELNEFYNDRVKEVYRRIVEKSYENQKIKDLMPGHFDSLAQKKKEDRQKGAANRFQVDKLGASEAFKTQLRKTLHSRSGKTYTDSQLTRLVTLYEKMTNGLQEKTSSSTKGRTKAVYGQLKTQRDRTMDAVMKITDMEIKPEELHLAEINLRELLNTENSIVGGVYNEDQFASYTVENLIGLFGSEQKAVTEELSKFQSTSGNSRKILNAYITKTKESANARMTGGVCVAADNPEPKNKNENIWDMKNYFQMVFQDPEAMMCQGLILLHSEKLNNENILCASLNPSSTYLYGVDEQALFSGIMKSLQTFAEENGFSKIVVSANAGIRTNRTGGEFAKVLDKTILAINETVTFDPPRPFSHRPKYNMDVMNVIWKK